MSKYSRPTGSYISFMSNQVKAHGGINLAQGIPGFMPPNELLQILSQICMNPIHQYAPGTGNKKLLSGLVKHYSQYYNYKLENFLVTNGGTEALTIIYTYLMGKIEGNFTSLAFNPVYEVYNNLPKIFKKKFIKFNYEDNGSIDFNKLLSTIKQNNVKIIFINTPGNPYGRFWTKEEFNTIIEMSERENFFIILDAVYNELYFNEKPYIPLEKLNKRIFYTNSFSKVFSITGWRIGYLITHPDHITEIQNIHDYIGLCSPSILQEALAIYIKESNFGKEYVSSLRLNLQKSFNLLSYKLKDLGFTIPSTKGGYFIWAKLPKQYSDGFKFTMDLYNKEKVAVIPGVHFSEECNNYIRINIAREENEIIEALKRIERFVKTK